MKRKTVLVLLLAALLISTVAAFAGCDDFNNDPSDGEYWAHEYYDYYFSPACEEMEQASEEGFSVKYESGLIIYYNNRIEWFEDKERDWKQSVIYKTNFTQTAIKFSEGEAQLLEGTFPFETCPNGSMFVDLSAFYNSIDYFSSLNIDERTIQVKEHGIYPLQYRTNAYYIYYGNTLVRCVRRDLLDWSGYSDEDIINLNFDIEEIPIVPDTYFEEVDYYRQPLTNDKDAPSITGTTWKLDEVSFASNWSGGNTSYYETSGLFNYLLDEYDGDMILSVGEDLKLDYNVDFDKTEVGNILIGYQDGDFDWSLIAGDDDDVTAEELSEYADLFIFNGLQENLSAMTLKQNGSDIEMEGRWYLADEYCESAFAETDGDTLIISLYGRDQWNFIRLSFTFSKVS